MCGSKERCGGRDVDVQIKESRDKISYGAESRSNELPLDGNFAVIFGGDRSESLDRHVDRVVCVARRAVVSNDGGHGLAIVQVSDLDALAAVLGLDVIRSVPGVVNGNNKIVVRVVVAAGTGVTALVKEGTESAKEVRVRARGRGGRSGGLVVVGVAALDVVCTLVVVGAAATPAGALVADWVGLADSVGLAVEW